MQLHQSISSYYVATVALLAAWHLLREVPHKLTTFMLCAGLTNCERMQSILGCPLCLLLASPYILPVFGP